MKKLHILIPSLVATISMPLVNLVGCGNEQDDPTPPEPSIQAFELDSFVKQGVNFNFYHNNVDLSVNTWYEANIDTSAHASELSGTKKWSFLVPVATFFESEFITITKVNIWIDEGQLHQVTDKSVDKLEPDEFLISENISICGKRNLDGKHKIKIQFQVGENAIRADLLFIASTS